MNLTSFLRRGAAIADLLHEAGMRPDRIQRNRHFSSHWGWDDGDMVFATVWMEDIQDPFGIPKWSQTDPGLRADLVGRTQRRKRAQALYDMLRRRAGQSIRVVLQQKKSDRSKHKSGIVDRRGVDPMPWYVAIEADAILVQRGSLPGRRDVALDGRQMPQRNPAFALRELRPEQRSFRERVASKSGHRCALTGAPLEVCDAAHFPWANWRTDNDVRHGVLLRRDLHAALDCGLLGIERDGTVAVSEYLASGSREYAELHGRQVPLSDEGTDVAPVEAAQMAEEGE